MGYEIMGKVKSRKLKEKLPQRLAKQKIIIINFLSFTSVEKLTSWKSHDENS